MGGVVMCLLGLPLWWVEVWRCISMGSCECDGRSTRKEGGTRAFNLFPVSLCSQSNRQRLLPGRGVEMICCGAKKSWFVVSSCRISISYQQTQSYISKRPNNPKLVKECGAAAEGSERSIMQRRTWRCPIWFRRHGLRRIPI